jgi:uncharacterized protein (DUF983 family)
MVGFLDHLQESDAKNEKINRSKYGAATICPKCGKNASVSFVPFWHRYRRILCEACGAEYVHLLKTLTAWNW